MARRQSSSSQKKEPTAVLSIRIPRSLKERLQQLARRDRRSLNQQIRWLIERGLEAQYPEDELPEG